MQPRPAASRLAGRRMHARCGLTFASRSRDEPRTFQIGACDLKHETGSRFPSVGEAAPGRDLPQCSPHCPTAAAPKCTRCIPARAGWGRKPPAGPQPAGMADCGAAGASLGGPGRLSLQELLTPRLQQNTPSDTQNGPGPQVPPFGARMLARVSSFPRRCCSAGARRRGGASISSCCSTSASSATAVVFTASRSPPVKHVYVPVLKNKSEF